MLLYAHDRGCTGRIGRWNPHNKHLSGWKWKLVERCLASVTGFTRFWWMTRQFNVEVRWTSHHREKKKKKLYDWGEEMKTDRISGQKISLIGKQANSVTLIRRSVLRWLLKLAFCHQTSVLDRQVVFVDLRPKNFQDLFIECWIVSSKCLSLQKASSSNMCRPLCLDKWSGEKIDVLDVWFAKKNADQGSGRDRLSFSFGLIP